MATLTIHEAASTTGWSARMLRYVEQQGLLDAPRSAAGYRLYGPGELQRLRTLRSLLERYSVELGDVGFALRLRREPALAEALDQWFSAEPRRPRDEADGAALPDGAWLAFEQDKHSQLLSPSPGQDTS